MMSTLSSLVEVERLEGAKSFETEERVVGAILNSCITC